MTPADKAKYLIEEMKGGCCRCPHDSKDAALTCCDEIIQQVDSYRIEYWQQVKEEIQKL